METDPLVEVNPRDALPLGIVHGEEIYVETPDKKIRLKACITEDIKPGMLGIIHGWEGAQNENVLSKNQPTDPVTGYPALMRNFACRLRKI